MPLASHTPKPSPRLKRRALLTLLLLPLPLLCLTGLLPSRVPAAAAAAAVVAAPCAEPNFRSALRHPNESSWSIAFGDFNRDGKTDLAEVGFFSQTTVKIWAGDGAGNFSEFAFYKTVSDSSSALWIISDDFNEDGITDLATANGFANNVSVLLGHGDGTFAFTNFATGLSPRYVTRGDFNGDGNLDLLTANFFSNSVSVLLGNGAGSFAPAPTPSFPVVTNPQTLKAADFNGDGKLDVAAGSESARGITVLLGDGAGGFTAAPNSFGNLTWGPSSLDDADFDADGRLDLVVANAGARHVSVWAGNGAGGFSAPADHSAGFGPSTVLVSDFNNDSRPDLFVTGDESNTVAILKGKAGGGFEAERRFTVGNRPEAAALADLNNDGVLDAVVSNRESAFNSILLGTGGGEFAAAPNYDMTFGGFGGVTSITRGDFDADGDLDLAATLGGSISVLRGDGAGGFAGKTSFPGPPFGGAGGGSVTADFDRDGKLDLAVSSSAGSSSVLIFLGDGAGNFAPRSIIQVNTSPTHLVVADFNEDGVPDLAASTFGGNAASVLLGDGTGGFERRAVPGSGVQSLFIATGDFNHDGHADLLTPISGFPDSRLAIALGDGAGNFTATPGVSFVPTASPQAAVVGDFNGDGKVDIAVDSTQGLHVVTGDGAGNFSAPVKVGNTALGELAGGDFNGDGHTDLATGGNGNLLAVYLGDGQGGFGLGNFGVPLNIPAGRLPRGIEAADFNGDGRTDLVTGNASGDATLLLNTCAAVPPALPSLSADAVAALNEGDTGTLDVTVNVRLSAASAKPVSAAYYFSGETAAKGSDFEPSSGTLTFAPGQTSKAVNVRVLGDTLDEFDETFKIALAFPLNASAGGAAPSFTILDNDAPPSASAADAAPAFEGTGVNTNFTFNVSLTAPSGKPVSVAFATADGTAEAGADYQAASGTLTFAPGETTKAVSVVVLGDTQVEPAETFFLNLASPSNVTLVDTQGAATITDDDTSVQFETAGQTFGETAGVLRVKVTRAGVLSGASTVNYSTLDATASQRSDYILSVGTLSFAAAETEKELAVLVVNDVLAEGTETFKVVLSAPTGAALGAQAEFVATVESDDAVNGQNPVEGAGFDAAFFVRQHYLDFLNREADAAGLAFWVNGIESCGADAGCRAVKRTDTSAAFFFSIEFQETGYLVYRMSKAAYGAMPGAPVPLRLEELLPDAQRLGRNVIVGTPGWPERLTANKDDYSREFVARARFAAVFPGGMTPEQFVITLNSNAGGVLDAGERAALIGELTANNIAAGRASVLLKVAEDPDLKSAELNKAFVLLQYIGYLRRNPNDAPDTNFRGWQFWLDKLNTFNGDWRAAQMVTAFIDSIEYKERFGP